jgi:ABC-type nitrate/sulfonate/bicarbonate transport system substrate-binding protein
MKIALPDLISNSYFPAAAAAELGAFKAEGVDMTLELIYPVDNCYRALKEGKVDFVAGSAHSVLAAFPEWQGAKLLCAQSQGMYWFLVMHQEFGARRGDLGAVKGRSIGAAPWVDIGLKRMLIAGGIDLERDNVKVQPVPGFGGGSISFGVTAARAMIERKIDGFWANGMGAEVAVTSGHGTLVADVRRGDGPKVAFNFTQPTIATTDAMIQNNPDTCAAVIRAITRTHRLLQADVKRATEVGKKLFPEQEAGLIAQVVARDFPFYDARITPEFVAGMNAFARDCGVLKGSPPFEQVVATQFKDLWAK